MATLDERLTEIAAELPDIPRYIVQAFYDWQWAPSVEEQGRAEAVVAEWGREHGFTLREFRALREAIRNGWTLPKRFR